MKHSQQVRAGVAGVAILMTSVLSACADTPGVATRDAEGRFEVTVAGASPSLSFGVPQLMDTEKIGEDRDLVVTYTAAGASSSNLVASVLSGEADFGFIASSTAIDAIEQGAGLIIVGGALESASVLVLSQNAAEESGTTADAPIGDRIQALKGLTVATSQEGSGNNILLRQLAAAEGLDPDEDMTIIPVQDPSAIVGGIKEGRFDAGFYGSGVLEVNIADGDGQLWLSTARDDAKELIGDQVNLVAVTSEKTLEAQPDMVSSMFQAMGDTEDLIATDPERAGQVLKETWFPDLDQAVFDLAWAEAQKAYPADPRLSTAQFATLIDALSASGSEYSVDYSEAVYEEARAS